MKTILIILSIFILGYGFEYDSTGAGIPIMIIHNRAYGMVIDTSYEVCCAHWGTKLGHWVRHYGKEPDFYPVELGYIVKRRYFK